MDSAITISGITASNRPDEITVEFLQQVDKHLADIVSGAATEMFEIRELAGLMFIHPTHLSNTIKENTGYSPCYFYEHRIIDTAKRLLLETKYSAARIAVNLTYDPSNFTKFFKKYVGVTPARFRALNGRLPADAMHPAPLGIAS